VDQAPEQDRNSAAPLSAKGFIAVAIPQALVWLLTTCTLQDAGRVSGVYSLVLVGYWGAIGLVWLLRVIRGRSLNRVVAVSGWLPPVGCLLWIVAVRAVAHLSERGT
jgi:hypothetical protein